MSYTNYISTTVKLLEEPQKKISAKPLTEARAQLSQVRDNKIRKLVNLIFWGNFAQDIAKYYKPNDYLMIEGYILVKSKMKRKLNSPPSKHVEIIVLKVYPVFLTSI